MNQRLIWPPSCFMIDYILSVIYLFIGFFCLYDIGLTLLYEKIKFSYPNKPKTWIVGGYFFRHFVWSREYWSHNFKQGIKRKDFLCSTTMVTILVWKNAIQGSKMTKTRATGGHFEKWRLPPLCHPQPTSTIENPDLRINTVTTTYHTTFNHQNCHDIVFLHNMPLD